MRRCAGGCLATMRHILATCGIRAALLSHASRRTSCTGHGLCGCLLPAAAHPPPVPTGAQVRKTVEEINKDDPR